jgi:hypothetical protein
MPPIIGAAMRFITSDPAPVDHIIGTSPRNMVAAVMSFGRMRRAAEGLLATHLVLAHDDDRSD